MVKAFVNYKALGFEFKYPLAFIGFTISLYEYQSTISSLWATVKGPYCYSGSTHHQPI